MGGRKLIGVALALCMLCAVAIPAVAPDPQVTTQDLKGIKPRRYRYIFSALGGAAMLVRLYHPEAAALPLAGWGLAYFGLLAACTATCVVLGYYGGKLVFH